MASINVKIFKEEKDKMLVVISKHRGETISVSKLAKEAGFNANRTRFIIEEMIEDGVIKKVQTRSFNDKYNRYTYELTGKRVQ